VCRAFIRFPIKLSNSQRAPGLPGSRQIKLRHPYSLRRRVRRNFSRLAPGTACATLQSRGDEAPRGASIQLTPCGVRVLGEGRAPRGAPRRLFCPRGRNFRARTGGLRPPRSGQLSPPFVRAASSHQRQSPIVGTDGDPRPPGDGVTSPARRRRTSRCRACPISAPFSGSIFETSREDALSRAIRLEYNPI
jgi:hypothetical protein